MTVTMPDMATVDDEMKEDIVYSLLHESLNSNLNEDVLSSEDVAWADSCFNNDVDSNSINWSSFQDALLEFLSSQPGGPDTAAAYGQHPLDDENLYWRRSVETLEFSRCSDEDDVVDYEIGEAESIGSSEDDDDDLILRNKRAMARGRRIRVKSVVQIHNTEDTVRLENPDSGLDLSLTANETGSSLEDLFKVWDLEIPDKEDDFTIELNKALSEIPPNESTVDDSTSWKDLLNVSVDDLIAGLDDLSLEQNTR